jgi:hypothetical protein
MPTIKENENASDCSGNCADAGFFVMMPLTESATRLNESAREKPKQETLPGSLRGLKNSDWFRLSGADDVTRLEPLGALQQIKLHGLALIQRTVTILLDGREMNEDVFPCGPLDKTVSFSPVKPLHSHNELLSPLLILKFHILREARA